MKKRNYKRTQYTQKAIAALLDKKVYNRGEGEEAGTEYKLKSPLPEIITGYDPTYILQFGFPQEPDYQQGAIVLDTLEDLQR